MENWECKCTLITVRMRIKIALTSAEVGRYVSYFLIAPNLMLKEYDIG
jgi:hypothetical protein